MVTEWPQIKGSQKKKKSSKPGPQVSEIEMRAEAWMSFVTADRQREGCTGFRGTFKLQRTPSLHSPLKFLDKDAESQSLGEI